MISSKILHVVLAFHFLPSVTVAVLDKIISTHVDLVSDNCYNESIIELQAIRQKMYVRFRFQPEKEIR